MTVQLCERDATHTTRIGRDMDATMAKKLVDFLRCNQDVFAFSPSDLVGMDSCLAVHRLNVKLRTKPVKQKMRHFGAQKDRIIHEEVQKLLSAGQICEISMMDASQGYHHIPLDQEDHAKVSFITSTGTYCYTVMPFGLKNAGATYQRLVDRMFRTKLGRNMEIYVDDMLDMQVSRLYMVTERGVEVNPEKVQAIINMRAPRNIKEVQTLAGRITALSRQFWEYEPRLAIKGQALADFLQETTRIHEEAEWRLFVDGASNSMGSGAGMVLQKEGEDEGEKYAIKLPFRASNNEAKYEAVIHVMKLAALAGARKVSIFSDSQLVVQQIKGEFEIKSGRMHGYCEKARALMKEFEKIDLTQIPREENIRADFLAKIGSMDMSCESRKVQIIMGELSISGKHKILEMMEIQDWRTEIKNYLLGRNQESSRERARLSQRARHFCLDGDILYKRGYTRPHLRFLSTEEGQYVLRETHEGCSGDHTGGRALIVRVLRSGYFWPTIRKDAIQFVKKCDKCQKHGPLIHVPGEDMTVISSPHPFPQWGIDIVGPLPLVSRQRKFLIVANG
ncbi:PREDICTED: uncharacterized protein LOC105970542 [Erythranthe guttata]|uniref:uncharacterized protein LOC105970542 n=1 Tax=Erythranthe guttata TaxID=4155 RepID=UPI00064DCCC6|nr:PREDICTED: uncharacterized protein LOC105970542 [Erythranthe guttata]|eukprot:XP_012850831.1 PREDICTED: uncharacterized protein LOC105970542 [Erythranthe guttata]